MKPIFPLLILLLIASCGGKKTALLQNESPDGKVKITVTGKRTTGIESWKVVMKVKSNSFKEGDLKFEIFAEDLTGKNVLFNWKDNTHCEIIFKQQDNTERKFNLIANQEQLQMGEM